MDNTPDVSKLCPECGHVLDVERHPEQDAEEAPLYALRCPECGWQRLDTEEPTRELTPGEVRLLARIAELEATVANERGQGKPPYEWWEYEPLDHAWVLYTPQGGFYVTREDNGWTWDADHISSGGPLCPTARDAMRKASEMVKQ